eukprot:SAG31_NODE_5718_length_2363_cov_53.435954_2_plen_92_part_00
MSPALAVPLLEAVDVGGEKINKGKGHGKSGGKGKGPVEGKGKGKGNHAVSIEELHEITFVNGEKGALLFDLFSSMHVVKLKAFKHHLRCQP